MLRTRAMAPGISSDITAPQPIFSPSSGTQPTVLVYRDMLIPRSETFIPAQVGAMTRFRGCYVGTRRSEASLPLMGSVTCLGEATAAPWGNRLAPLWKTLFKTGGQLPPGWLDRLRRLNPDLLHAHFGPDGTFALPLAQALGIPLVVTFHGYDATLTGPSEARSALALGQQFLRQRGTFYREQYLRRRSRLFAEADCIIAVSQFIADRLLAVGCPESKLRVHYIGIDRSQFEPCQADPHQVAPHPDDPRPIVLFVGRLVEKKGAADLIEACAQLADLGPRLVVIGEGPLRSELEALAQGLQIDATFLGHQPPVVVRDWMGRAQVFSVPSRTARSGDAEGLGMVFAEAQAIGLPVVSCRSGGVVEVVQDGVTGLLVPEADPRALAEALGRLLADGDWRRRLGAAGPGWVADRFDLRANTAELEVLYDQVLAEFQRRR